MKIGIITHPYFFEKNTGRGQDRYAYELIKGLETSYGLSPKIIHSNRVGDVFEAMVKEIFFPFKLIREKLDVYHAIDPIGAKTAIFLKKTPLVTTIHDIIPFQYKDVKHRYQQWCTKLAIKKSDVIIVPFKFTKNYIISKFDIPDKKIEIIPYGVDHDFFYPRKIRKGKTKKVLYLGELSRNKGVDILIKAFKEVLEHMNNVQLLIGGKGHDLDFFKNLVYKLKIDDKVKFLGFIPEEDLPILYSKVDVLVFPSKLGFGLPTLEAMACGCPVIAGASLDSIDFFQDRDFLVDPNNPDELSNKILKILKNERYSNSLSKKGIRISRQYSWKRNIESTYEIYTELYNKHGG